MRRWLAFAVLIGCKFDPPAATTTDAVAGTTDGASASDGASHTGRDASASGGDGGGPALACPSGSGWFQIDGQAAWFFASSDSQEWKDAETACEAMEVVDGSAIHLAVLPTLDLLTAIAQHGSSPDYWIGMFQQKSQSAPDVGWLWITGGSGYGSGSAWASGEPNDDSSIFGNSSEDDDEDFAELYPAGNLNDAKQSKSYHYMCECDGVAVPPAVAALEP